MFGHNGCKGHKGKEVQPNVKVDASLWIIVLLFELSSLYCFSVLSLFYIAFYTTVYLSSDDSIM